MAADGRNFSVLSHQGGDHTENSKWLYINTDTGQAIERGDIARIITKEEAELANVRKEYKKQQEYLEAKKKTFYAGYGNFVWMLYRPEEGIFPMLSASDVTRIIYLGTYTGYDGYLTKHKHGRLSKKEVEPLMQLSKTTFKDFWRSAADAGILHEEADGIRIDAKYFRKGPIQYQNKK